MGKTETQRAAGWWHFAGHRWPVQAVELREGVVRVTINGLATRDVPEGETSGELYGVDGALVFRVPVMGHAALSAGDYGSLALNFVLPQAGPVVGDLSDESIRQAVENFSIDPAPDLVTTSDLLDRARKMWVWWRETAIIIGASGAMIILQENGVPFPAACAVGMVGCGIGIFAEKIFDRKKWWNK